MERKNVFSQSSCPVCKKIMQIDEIDSNRLGLVCASCRGAVVGTKKEFVNGTVLSNYGKEESDFIESNIRFFEDLCESSITIRLRVDCDKCKEITEYIFIEKYQDSIDAYVMCTKCKSVRPATEGEIKRVIYSSPVG